jgi:chemotaxis protein CheC
MIWSALISGPRAIGRLNKVMWRVANGLSEVTGRSISNDVPTIQKVPLAEVPDRAGGPEAKMVGIYMVIGGGIHGQAILIMPIESALNLTDLMMNEAPGTSTELGILEQSALSEIGNMTLAYFLNGVAALDEMPDMLRPSPPAIMVDMIGAILNVIITPVAAVRDDLVIIETAFKDPGRTVEGRFWVLPDPGILDLAV